MSRISVLTAALLACSTMRLGDRQVLSAQSQPAKLQYRVLATSRTSTMQKELNEAAEAGFRFQAFMGGETAFGGDEVVAWADKISRQTSDERACEHGCSRPFGHGGLT